MGAVEDPRGCGTKGVLLLVAQKVRILIPLWFWFRLSYPSGYEELVDDICKERTAEL